MSLGTQGPRSHGLPPAARGAALIGLLVIIGIIGLQVLDDSSPGSSEVTVTTLPGQTTLPGATTLAPASTAATATTKAAPPRPPRPRPRPRRPRPPPRWRARS